MASGSRPAVDYNITVVRHVTKKQVLRRLGVVTTDLGPLTYRQAESYAMDRGGSDYSVPTVVQVSRLGHAIVVYQPLGSRAFFHAKRMSGHALMASFITDVNLDTYLKVARHGTTIRQFDAMFRPPRKGALPEEQGLHFGAPRGNLFARSWALIERVTLTHVSQTWFKQPHPTYVLKGRS